MRICQVCLNKHVLAYLVTYFSKHRLGPILYYVYSKIVTNPVSSPMNAGQGRPFYGGMTHVASLKF